MIGEVSVSDVKDIKNPSVENYNNIKPDSKHTMLQENEYWKGEFRKESEAANIDNQSGIKEYKDDNGERYREGDKLVPNNEYELNGYKYKTDNEGRIVSAEGKLKLRDPEYSRNMEHVRNMENQEYHKTDDQSHLIGHQFGGSDRLGNLVPMDFKLNRGDFSKLENTLADAVEGGADVRMKVEPIYEENSARPSEFRVTYSIDGERDVVVFKNEGEANYDK